MIKIKKIVYVENTDETTIYYNEIFRNKVEEKFVSFKGKIDFKPTEYNTRLKVEKLLLKEII